MKSARIISTTTCMILLIELSVSCSKQSAFQLHILEMRFEQLGLGYKAEQSWAILETIDLNNSAFIIADTDIDSYDWPTQTITLTSSASSRFKDTFGGDLSSINLDHHAFVVTLSGERLYGGLFLQVGSAMPIDYPVIYIEAYQLYKVLLHVRPCHPFGQIDQSRLQEIEFQSVYDLFDEQGKLVQ